MKNKIILLMLLTLGVGIAIGYLLFNQSTNQTPTPTSENVASRTTYTCSMHPQIRQKEPGICPICEMDLVPLTENLSDDPLVLQMTAESVQLSNISTTTIGKKTTESTTEGIRLSGKVETDERQVSNEIAEVAGRIEQLYVSFIGEQVKRGQRLAKIYSPELISAQQELLEALKIKELSPNLVEAARTKLRYLKIDKTTITAIETSGLVQENFFITAQHTGVVAARKVAVGNYVRQGEVLFELVDLSKVWVLFEAYENDLPLIEIGDRISFTVPSLPNQNFTSKVTFIAPTLDAKMRVATIRTEVNNRNKSLKPGMLAYGVLQQKSKTNSSLSIPKSAVLWTGKRSVVYVKLPSTNIPSYQFREVVLGERIGDQYVVLEGLEAGEDVVTNGAFAIDAAAQLNNQASMMNRNIAVKGSTTPVVPDFRATIPEVFQNDLSLLIEKYINLKDVLVKSEVEQAQVAANELVAALNRIQDNTLSSTVLAYWTTKKEAIKAHTTNIQQANSLNAQREQFRFLSEAMINVVTAFGHDSEQTIYVQHCPMVADNKGGNWLALQEQILNPYFGDRMLKCGSVVEILEK